MLGRQQNPSPEPDPLSHRGRRSQSDERVQAALVVVESHTLDQGRRHVLSDREMCVLGQPERVETHLLDR